MFFALIYYSTGIEAKKSFPLSFSIKFFSYTDLESWTLSKSQR